MRCLSCNQIELTDRERETDVLRQARVISTRPQNDLLAGRTVALKDNIALAGVRCTNGTDLAGWEPDLDATIVKRILDSSGTILGKAGKMVIECSSRLRLTDCYFSACESGCWSTVSDTSITGPVRNPYNPGYSCGGSSSGSARLVAGGAVDMAIVGPKEKTTPNPRESQHV